MKAIEVILLPFVFIYKGFIFVLLTPYYFVLGIVKVFKLIFGREQTNERTVIPELRNDQEVKVVNTVKSIYKENNLPKETDPVKIKQAKDANTLKRQQEFERLVQKKRKI